MLDVIFVLMQKPFLGLPHLVEVVRSPQLGSAEYEMKNRCDDLERQCPAVPGPTPQIHYGNSLDNRAHEGDDASGQKDFAEVVVIGRVHSIQDNGDMGPKFSEHVEHSCRLGQRSKLESIPLYRQVLPQT
jgi:hypothetical protein